MWHCATHENPLEFITVQDYLFYNACHLFREFPSPSFEKCEKLKLEHLTKWARSSDKLLPWSKYNLTAEKSNHFIVRCLFYGRMSFVQMKFQEIASVAQCNTNFKYEFIAVSCLWKLHTNASNTQASAREKN